MKHRKFWQMQKEKLSLQDEGKKKLKGKNCNVEIVLCGQHFLHENTMLK